MGKTVVLYPAPGVGHLTPMVELAKVFVQHGVSVTLALAEPQVKTTHFSDTVAHAAASNPSVTFHVLTPPALQTNASIGMFEYLRLMNAPLRDFLRSLPAVHALVLDMFCGGSLDVAAELGVPAYFFLSSGASFLAVFLSLPGMAATMGKKFSELGDSSVHLPGVPPFKATDLPRIVRDDDDTTRDFLRMAERIPEANGILVNTLESLEARAVRALRDGLCVPNRPTPPVYCIGPLVSGGGGDKKHECLEWLDAQPDNSVVFLSFGSMGTFSKKQLQEIAIGLEKSEQRFLWVVRSPRREDQKVGDPLPEPDLDAVLPEGFLERTKHRGLVVKSWAPQVEVLRHRATGAFMTHCGWNSTLEGITAGLLLLCWPLYAEQRLNKVFIVEDMKLGVELKGYENEIVEAEEVEMKIKWVMDSDGGRALRQRAAAEKNRAAEALMDGGSSHGAFVEFLNRL